MAKVRCLVVLALLINGAVRAQTAYGITYIADDSATIANMGFLKSFPSRTAALEYIAKAPALLQSKGYMAASVDSVAADSLQATAYLYIGEPYQWATIKTDARDAALLDAARWNSSIKTGPVNFAAFQAAQQRLFSYLEETGYPFARIFLDSIALSHDKVS